MVWQRRKHGCFKVVMSESCPNTKHFPRMSESPRLFLAGSGRGTYSETLWKWSGSAIPTVLALKPAASSSLISWDHLWGDRRKWNTKKTKRSEVWTTIPSCGMALRCGGLEMSAGCVWLLRLTQELGAAICPNQETGSPQRGLRYQMLTMSCVLLLNTWSPLSQRYQNMLVARGLCRKIKSSYVFKFIAYE